ncbi:bestrophin-like domain [Paracraurococcus lichenis]|uniref:DUF4239 domain-containing protein n=1 Tax=Paracraurococcus lichenis TaxID=3064888 RepID=A0ABT9ECW0_9PROT|nr:DUF4239 domain-containing protein [Paracraurococcus sp. LOR1-02]MDO9713813.1 DUF4239 domain-containing protein [Paracraurococcus sp. LOR1-02]
MSPIAIAFTIFLGSFAAALLGVALRLPSQHFDDSSREVVRSVLGLVATLTALVLGLLVASAQGTYQSLGNQLGQMAANLVELDRALDYYGPEAAPARSLFHHAVQAEIDRIWPHGEARLASIRPDDTRRERGQFMAIIGRLEPRDEAQRFAQRRIMELVTDFARMRTLTVNATEGSLPGPFLTVLIFWVAVLFFGFGLSARFNPTVLVALSIGALSVAGAMYLILELNHPFDGLMRVSEAPLREALGGMSE